MNFALGRILIIVGLSLPLLGCSNAPRPQKRVPDALLALPETPQTPFKSFAVTPTGPTPRAVAIIFSNANYATLQWVMFRATNLAGPWQPMTNGWAAPYVEVTVKDLVTNRQCFYRPAFVSL